MGRVYNFSAGPAALPEQVLMKAKGDLLDYRHTGISVMEMSHRSKEFASIIEGAEANLRKLLAIPSNYKVLFLQGGASLQFAMVPANLMKRGKAGYILTGVWAKKAYQEGKRFGEATVLASSEDQNYSYIPDPSLISVPEDLDYVYICENNTIYGTKYPCLPACHDIPLVADMSSCLLSEPIDVTKYGLIFAGAQKNIGPAGVTVVIIREDLIPSDLPESIPTMLRYKTHADASSLYNTPNCYGIYMCGLVFEHLLELGGLDKMKELNEQKARLLYDALDASALFVATARPDSRSLMNVPFVIDPKKVSDENKRKELEKKFLLEAENKGLIGLKGHRSVGGMRASIYNAMPLSGVEALVGEINRFTKENA